VGGGEGREEEEKWMMGIVEVQVVGREREGERGRARGGGGTKQASGKTERE
jgi:hypothetical protein